MSNKRLIAIVLLVTMASLVRGADLGVYIGSNIDSKNFCYGLALDIGTLVPLLKIGFDYYRESEQPLKLFSLDVKLKSSVGGFKPFVGMGVAAGWEKFNLKFSEYEFFSFLTAGLFLKVLKIFSLRLEGRFPFSKEKSFTRLTAGLFLSI